MARSSSDTTEISPWVLGFRGTALPRPLARALRNGRLSGLILFRDNLGGSWDAARALRAEVLSLVPRPDSFLFLVDEEGGLISQTSGLLLPGSGPRNVAAKARATAVATSRAAPAAAAWPSLPTPRALGRIGRFTDCRWVGRTLGLRLRSLGFQIDLAPCLDLDVDTANPVIGSRCLGADPETVATLGEAFARGLADAGVIACYKHYPGHGATRVDSHLALPLVDPARRAESLRPFRLCLHSARAHPQRFARTSGAIGSSLAPWTMTGHLDWGDGQPASLRPQLLSRLRRWNPRSLVITDALEMGAVNLPGGAAGRALLAGNDLLLVGRDWEAGLAALSALEKRAESDSLVGAALRRARQRISRVIAGLPAMAAATHPARSKARQLPGAAERGDHVAGRRELSAGPEPEDGTILRRLHRESIRLSDSPSVLPRGPWVWMVPEALAPYCDLRPFRPGPGRHRFCAELVWIPQGASGTTISRLAHRMRKELRPVLLATLFRGRPDARTAEAFEPLRALPGLRVVAHLLDETWPGARPGLLIAQTSGPSVESLNALAEALDNADDRWIRGPGGRYFTVDTRA